MATPKDPNKTLLEEQALIDKQQRLLDSQVAEVRNGDVVGGYTIVVTNNKVTGITPPTP